MTYKPGDSFYGEFCTHRFDTGVATNADLTPVATATKNGVDDAAFVLTVTNLATGRYKVTGTVPAGYAAGNAVQISVSATVNGVTGKAVVDSFIVDTKRLADLQDVSVLAIWTYGTRTLTSFGTLIADVWAYATRTLTSISGVLSQCFSVNTGQTYATSVAGSVVKEIADNAVGGSGPTVGEIADAVWDESMVGHGIIGSAGFYVTDTLAEIEAGVVVREMQDAALQHFFTVNSGTTYAGAVAGSVVKEITDNAASGSASTIADAVWDELRADHTVVGTFGEGLGNLVLRIGIWTGTGVNTVLGGIQAICSKVASLVSDIGGTFDSSTDSLEALRDFLETVIPGGGGPPPGGSWAAGYKTLGDLRAEVQDLLESEGATVPASERMVRALNRAKNDLVSHMERFDAAQFATRVSRSVATGDATISLPTLLLSEAPFRRLLGVYEVGADGSEIPIPVFDRRSEAIKPLYETTNTEFWMYREGGLLYFASPTGAPRTMSVRIRYATAIEDLPGLDGAAVYNLPDEWTDLIVIRAALDLIPATLQAAVVKWQTRLAERLANLAVNFSGRVAVEALRIKRT